MCVRHFMLRYTFVIGLALLLVACSSAKNTATDFQPLSDIQQIVDAPKGVGTSPTLPLSIVMEPKSGIYESTLKITFEHDANTSVYYAFNSKEDFLDLTAPGITKHDGQVIEIKNQHGVINAVAVDSMGARSRVFSVPFKYLNPEEEIWLEDLFDWPGLTEEEKNKKALADYLHAYFNYWQDDRDTMLDTALLALVIRGERVVGDIKAVLSQTGPTQELVRKALIVALGDIAQELSLATDPTMKAGRQQIHDLFLKMLQTPATLLTPEDLKDKNPTQIEGVLEKGGQFFQTHELSKLAILAALRNIGDDSAKKLLESVAKNPRQYTGFLSNIAVENLGALTPSPEAQHE